ncbi:MAG: nucleotidyltransferase family protein [Phycisphaerae bacterium]|nr:nucleotidyltransferase family protein [Phycisphaerae bacterium]
MGIHKDFKELLESFNARGVDYVVVGGYALAFYGAPRYTGDIDLLVNRDPANTQRIVAALADFGFASLELTAEDFQNPDQIIQLGVPPVRIDLVTSIDGVSWPQAWNGKVEGSYGDTPVWFISREDLIANKKASGRPQDLADLQALRKRL